jgi:hypothetical protein
MAFDRATIPGELINQIKAGNCVLFVGAGVSIGAGLPAWEVLLDQMLDWCMRRPVDLRTRPEDIRDRIHQRRLLEVAQTLRERMGNQCFLEFLRDALSAPHLRRPSPVHLLLSEIPFSAIITTNYDKLIENAFASHQGRVLPVYTPQDIPAMANLPGERELYLLKVHGDVDRPETVVLGRRDYHRILYENSPFKCCFTSLWQTKTLLFVGSGFEDEDITLRLGELSEMFKGYGRWHFALMPADPALSVWRERFERDYHIHR